MNKINYDKHDLIDGEPITEALFNNIESGVGRATSSTNLLVDRTNQEEESLSIIEGKIEHQDMEFDIAIGEHDTLDERLKADVSRFVEVWSGGNYMPFEGKNIMVNNSKVGWIRDFSMKGETYQNLINTNSEIFFGGSSEYENIIDNNNKREVKALSDGSMLLYKNGMFKDNTTYTVVVNVFVSRDIQLAFSFDKSGSGSGQGFKNLSPIKVGNYATYIVPITTTTNCTSVVIGNHGDFLTNDVLGIDKLMIFEGDYTNKEIPSSYIDGIVGAGELKDDGQYEIEILSHGKNLLNLKDLEVKGYISINTIINENEIIVNNYTGTWDSVNLYKKLKPNTKYFLSYIYDRNDNDKDGLYYRSVRVCLNKANPDSKISQFNNSFNNNKRNIYQSGFFTTDSTGDALFVFYVASNRQVNNINVKISEIMLVETDTATEYDPYKKNKTQILLDEPLMKLPNGIADTIEQREDVVYLVQRIEKVTYAEGDENLDNCITDKTISYKAKVTPIETKLDLDMSKWLTYRDVTYFTTTCNVQPTLSLKAPVDIQATVSNLQATNYSLRQRNEQLREEKEVAEQNLNEIQENQNNQTAMILDLDMRVLEKELEKE